MLRGDRGHRVDEALAAETPSADGEDHGRPVAGADDHVSGPGRAVEEVPRFELALLLLDDEHTATREDEKVLLRVLRVVPAEALAWLEDTDVDAELREAPLPLEVAVDAERAPLAPADLARVDDEPALSVGHEAELRHP